MLFRSISSSSDRGWARGLTEEHHERSGAAELASLFGLDREEVYEDAGEDEGEGLHATAPEEERATAEAVEGEDADEAVDTLTLQNSSYGGIYHKNAR